MISDERPQPETAEAGWFYAKSDMETQFVKQANNIQRKQLTEAGRFLVALALNKLAEKQLKLLVGSMRDPQWRRELTSVEQSC